MKIRLIIYLCLIVSSSLSQAGQVNRKNFDSQQTDFRSHQQNGINEIDMVDQLIKNKNKMKKNNSGRALEQQLNLNDCHLGESVFNSFAQVHFDLKKKKMAYKEFDQNQAEIINIPDIICTTENNEHVFCQIETKKISIHFFNIKNQNTEKNKNLMSHIRFAFGHDVLYANTIDGIIERPYYDLEFKRWSKRTDTIRCIQELF